MTQIRLDQLTFTRFVAAMTVVVFHFGHDVFPFDVSPVDRLVFTEAIAVSYFFVLSGFIMAVVYYRPGGRVDKLAYWNARFARIYPIYALALAIPVLETLRAGTANVTAITLDALLLQAWLPPYPLSLNAPAWSLSVEAFFYLVFPFFVLKASTWNDRKLVALSVALWASTQLLHVYLLNHRYVGYPSRSHDFIFYDPLLHLSTFVVGATAGILLVRNRLRIAVPRYAAAPIWLLACASVALAVMHERAIDDALGVRVTLNNGALAPLFAVLIVALSVDDRRVVRVFRHRWPVLLGEASYAVYLLQIPLHSIYEATVQRPFPLSPQWHFYLYAAMLVGVSVAAFRWIEQPSRARLRAWYAARSIRIAGAHADP